MIKYHLLAFAIVVVWGSTFISTKQLLVSGLSPAQIFTLRFLIAYVLMLFVCHDKWRCRLWRDELLIMMLGITGGSLYFMTENAALLYTTTTNTSLIVCSCPLLAAVLISLFYKSERLRPIQIVGTLMAVMGVAVVVLNGHFVLHLSPLGDALALTACLCWAVYSLLMIPAGQRYGALFITRKVFFYGLITMIPYYFVHPDWPSLQVLLRPNVMMHLLFLGCVASMLCFLLWALVMGKLGAMVATNYVYVNPISTMVFAWSILGEQITQYFLLGATLILMGMFLADKKNLK